jgi:predicted nucleotidyltransferase
MTTDSSQGGFAALFASGTLVGLLRVFLLDPEREVYQRELQRLTGAHLRQLQRDLARLEQSGLVAKAIRGNRTYYRAVRTHPAFADLRQAIAKTVGVGQAFRDALAPFAGSVAAAFVYGSVARGDDTAESDIDLLIVGDVSRLGISQALTACTKDLGREVSLVLYGPQEFAARLHAADHFVTAVLAEPRIWLIGDEQALAELG